MEKKNLPDVYISCPASEDYTHIINSIVRNNTNSAIFSYWRQHLIYNKNWLKEADVIIFILPNNQFKATRGNLPTGVKRELEIAISLNKRILIAYQRSDSNIKLYDTEVDNYFIGGIAGKYAVLRNVVDDIEETPIWDTKAVEYGRMSCGGMSGGTLQQVSRNHSDRQVVNALEKRLKTLKLLLLLR